MGGRHMGVHGADKRNNKDSLCKYAGLQAANGIPDLLTAWSDGEGDLGLDAC